MLIEALTAFGLSWVLNNILVLYAPRLGLVDRPNPRSMHRHPIPRGAGIAFTLAALGTLVLFHPRLLHDHFPFFGALVMILAIGILDDRHEARPRTKFFIIALAVAILGFDGLLIDEVGRYFGIQVRFGYLALPFTFFALSGFTNAMNLIDGLDALAGTLAFWILGSLLLLGLLHRDQMLIWLPLLFMASLAAFLIFNWPPATVFMGDSGSLTLGFLIAALCIRALEYLPAVSMLYLGAVPIIDTLVAMIRRKLYGRSAIAADRCHLHHLLLRRTGSIIKTVLAILVLQMPFSAIGLLLPRNIEQAPALILFLLLVLVGYVWVRQMIRQEGIDCYE